MTDRDQEIDRADSKQDQKTFGELVFEPGRPGEEERERKEKDSQWWKRLPDGPLQCQYKQVA